MEGYNHLLLTGLWYLYCEVKGRVKNNNFTCKNDLIRKMPLNDFLKKLKVLTILFNTIKVF